VLMMTGEEVQDTYFSPLNFVLYLAIVLALMVAYLQWTWAKKCNENVRVLVVKPDGNTDTEYSPKTGQYVALRSGQEGREGTRLWPINQLSAIEMLYPGDGFIPKFLQKKIKTVIVSEEDWEPLLNRGSYNKMVASPDVVAMLRELAEKLPNDEDSELLSTFCSELKTAPTREMVASPALLGNIMHEKVSELVTTITKEAFEKLEGIVRRLDQFPKAQVLYLLIGIVAIISLVALIKVLTMSGDVSHVKDTADAIKLWVDTGVSTPTAP